MVGSDTSLTQVELTRTGRRAGCTCCSFTAFGMMGLPVLVLALFILVAL
jgi:hypothetical protein